MRDENAGSPCPAQMSVARKSTYRRVARSLPTSLYMSGAPDALPNRDRSTLGAVEFRDESGRDLGRPRFSVECLALIDDFSAYHCEFGFNGGYLRLLA